MRATVALTRACQHLFRELFFVEGDDFLDVANAALEVFAEADDFANDDGRTRDGLDHAQLAALDALGDFDFAFASEQRDGAHFAQYMRTGSLVFSSVPGVRSSSTSSSLRRLRARTFRARQICRRRRRLDALGVDGGEEIVEVVGWR